MTIKVFEKEKAKLLQQPEILEAWLAYQSRFPHLSKYFRASDQYPHQMAVVNGKKTGSDINLYKLFLEQCVNLLKTGGQCGIVIPSGIYTDLGATGLRQLLFNETQITSLFCFENRKAIFEGVHRSFKFVVLSFEKGKKTTEFPAMFMRHDVNELADFPQTGTLILNTDLIRRLSPDSQSVMEFKNAMDVHIAEKMLQFPLLGEKLEGVWNLALTSEFHMTNDSHLFHTEPAKDRLPLYEGKMIHQFEHQFAEPRYWVDEEEGRKALLGKKAEDSGQLLDYQRYRLGFRDVASSTNERTMIATVLPPKIFCPHTMSLEMVAQSSLSPKERIFLVALFNSYLVDYLIRQRITAHLSFFFVYNLPIPRLTKTDAAFTPIVTRAAQLICTTPEFDDLAKAVGLNSHKNGVTDPKKRAQLRAELDGMVAHLYGLTQKEFEHILATFPLVKPEVKESALKAYLKFAKKQ
ncbi:type II DNA modification enzyme [Beggiatoa sp. PS]|nr:type II DNA modification enzyme [Beggiatoa sp. PS]